MPTSTPTSGDAYTKADFFPPYIARALRYALQNSDPESLRALVDEIVAYPIPDDAPVRSHALGALEEDGVVTTQLPVAATAANQGLLATPAASRSDTADLRERLSAALAELLPGPRRARTGSTVVPEGNGSPRDRVVEAVLAVVIPDLDRPREQSNEFVAASLQHDYTVDGECPEYTDDAAERAAALANITEMHRLLALRANRLFDAMEHDRCLRAENERLRAELAVTDADKTHNQPAEGN